MKKRGIFIRNGKKNVKGGTNFGVDGNNNFTDLSSTTEEFFSS